MPRKKGVKNKGRYIDTYGYVRILIPTHEYADKMGYVCEHRLVMEKFLGRYLLPEEEVHHINRIKADNRIENLELHDGSSHRRKHNLEDNPFKGKKHSRETKEKMSEARKRYWSNL